MKSFLEMSWINDRLLDNSETGRSLHKTPVSGTTSQTLYIIQHPAFVYVRGVCKVNLASR